MVYRGKPSAGCESCRARRLKCDRRLPSCSQCIRAKKECSGYQDPNALRFFDQTKEVTSKARARALARKLGKPPNTDERQPTSPPSMLSVYWPTSLEDTAWSHVFTYFVGQHSNQGVLSFLPDLLCTGASDGLQAIVKSLGLACVSRIHGLHDARRESNELYSIALWETNKDLQNPTTAKSDSTLAVVVMLSMYEIVACNESDVVDSWMNHARGAMRLLELRGNEQLKTPAGMDLFTTVRLQVTLANIFYRQNYHSSPIIAALSKAARLEHAKQTQSASHKDFRNAFSCSPKQPPQDVPPTQKDHTDSPQPVQSPASIGDEYRTPVRPAAKATSNYQPIEDFYDIIIRFNDLAIQISAAYEANQFSGNVTPLINEGLRLDTEFAAWATTFQAVTGYQVIRSSSPIHSNITFPTHRDEYHIYTSMRLATFWNHYRQARLSLNEMIEAMAYGMSQFLPVPQLEGIKLQVIATNKRMVNDVCASVPYFFMSDPAGFGGVSRLPWPLFIAAGSLHASSYTKQWISEILDVIGRCSGIHQATVMSLRIKLGDYNVHGGMIPGKGAEELGILG